MTVTLLIVEPVKPVTLSRGREVDGGLETSSLPLLPGSLLDCGGSVRLILTAVGTQMDTGGTGAKQQGKEGLGQRNGIF